MSKANLYFLMGKEPDLHGLLKDRFEHWEQEPEIDLWPEIEEKIRENPGHWVSMRPYLAVAATVIVLVSLWLFSQRAPEAKAPVAENLIEQKAPEKKETYKREMAAIPSTFPKQETEEKKQQPATKITKNYVHVPGREPITATPIEQMVQVAKANISEQNTRKVANLEWKAKEGQSLAQVTQKLESVNLPPMKKAVVKAQPKAIELTKHKTEINLDEMTFKDAVGFAADQINKRREEVPLPWKVKEEKTRKGVRKTYEFKIFNLSISKKTYRSNNTK